MLSMNSSTSLPEVAEVFRHGQAGQGTRIRGSGRLVHLAEDQRRLADDAGLRHFVPEVVALAGRSPTPAKTE
jgi:hypothetical protein